MSFVPGTVDYFLLLLFLVLSLVCGVLTSFLFLGAFSGYSSCEDKSHRSKQGVAGDGSKPLDLLEYFLSLALCAVLVTSFILLITAELGVFRFRYWLSLLILYNLASILLFRRRLLSWIWLPFSGKLRWSRIDLVVLPIGLLAFLMFCPTSEFVTTHRDPGEYVNIAIKVAETGSLRFQDPDFQKFDSKEMQSLFLPSSLEHAPIQEVLPGFNLVDPAKGIMLPQYFHLFPLFLALGFKLWRFQGIFSVNVLFGILSVLVMIPLGTRLFGTKSVGFAAALLMILNPAQIWIVRSPFSEILTQLLFLGGLWMLAMASSESHYGPSSLAGLCFGLSLLVRLDSVLVVGTLILMMIGSVIFGMRRTLPFARAPFFLALLLVTFYAVFHAAFFSYPYFETVLDTVLGEASAWSIRTGLGQIPARHIVGGLAATLVLGLLGVSAVWGWFKSRRSTSSLEMNHLAAMQSPQQSPNLFQSHSGSAEVSNERMTGPGSLLFLEKNRWSKAGKILFTGFSLGISSLWIYGYFIRPLLPSAREIVALPPPHTGRIWLYNEINLPRLGWYLTPLGLACAFAGSLISVNWLIQRKKKVLFPFLLILSVASLFYLYKSRIFPDNYWIIRRYIPLIIPGFVLLAAQAVVWIAGFSKRNNGKQARITGMVRHYLPVAIASLFFSYLLVNDLATFRPFLQERELTHSLTQLETLAGMTNHADIILIERGESQDFISGPLNCIFHKTIYPLGSQKPDPDLFDKVVGTWLGQGKRIQLISSEETTALPTRQIGFVPISGLEFQTRLAESSYERLPRIMEIFRLHLQIYDVQKRNAAAIPTSLAVNFGYNFGFRTFGFHRTEMTSSEETYRWTAESASIELPEIDDSSDVTLIVRLGQDLPEGVELGPAKILFNGKLIADADFRGKLHTVKYAIPRSLLNLQGANKVEFVTPTFSPASHGLSDDKRELGLMLDSLLLQSLRPISSANPYQVNLGSELGDVEGDLTGFYLRVADRYRWTEPVATIRLPVSLKNDEDMILSLRAVKSCPDSGFRQRIRVSADGREIGNSELIGVGDQFKVYQFPIPRNLPHSEMPSIEIRVDPPWTPKSSGQSVDWRTLGCALDWVRIGGDRKSGPMSASKAGPGLEADKRFGK
jgi:hypothetical protein